MGTHTKRRFPQIYPKRQYILLMAVCLPTIPFILPRNKTKCSVAKLWLITETTEQICVSPV